MFLLACGVIVVLQKHCQSRPRPGKARAHGADIDVADLGDFDVGQVVHFIEDYHIPVVRRQQLQRMAYALGPLIGQ